MALNIRKFTTGIALVGSSSTTIDTAGEIQYNSSSNKFIVNNGSSNSPLVSESHTATLTNKTIDADSNTITNIENADIKSGAAIAYSKLALSNSIVNADINASAAIVYSKLSLSNSIVNADINASAGISYSKLALSNSIVNADINSSAGIAYSKLALTGSIVNADISNSAAVARSKVAVGSLDHVLINDGSGNLSSESELHPSRGGTGISNGSTLAWGPHNIELTTANNTSITLPTTGTLATEEGNNEFEGFNQFNEAITIQELDPSPTTPSSGFGKIYFKTDGFLYQLNDDGTETKVGAGTSGINYITNSDADSNTLGWAAYADAAGTSPVDGTGGSPTVTITRTTSTPLRGAGSFLLTKDAANRQGQGVSYAFTIAEADKAKPLAVSFNYSIASGTFVSGDSSDLLVYLYDVTNAQVIQPAPYTIQGGAGSNHRFLSTFQTASNSSSYRLIIHCATTSASAYTFKFDDVSVGPQSLNYGSPVTDWLAYTPTIVGFGTVSNNSAFYRRVGDSIEVLGRFTSGTSTAAAATISLPSGLSLNTSKLISTSQTNTLGTLTTAGGTANLASTTNGPFIITESFSTSLTNVYIALRTGTGFNHYAADSGSGIAASGASLSYQFKAPIAGWSSTVEMSNDTDTRVVAAKSNGATTTVNTGTPIIVFPTKMYDTHGAYNTSTGRYTIQVPGYYRVSTNLRFNSAAYGANQVIELYIYKNGSQLSILDRLVTAALTTAYMIDGSDTIYCVAGDIIDIRAYNDVSVSLVGGSNANLFAIDRISGPSAIAASEKIVARYQSANTDTIPNGTNTIVDFGDRIIDTHSAVTTGASWKFTSPRNGYYRVSALVESAAGGGWNNGELWGVRLYKNGNGVSYLGIKYYETTGSIAVAGGSDVISLNAGDYIDIRIFQTSGASMGTGNNPEVKYVSIESI